MHGLDVYLLGVGFRAVRRFPEEGVEILHRSCDISPTVRTKANELRSSQAFALEIYTNYVRLPE
jgi:hypothetical protein